MHTKYRSWGNGFPTKQPDHDASAAFVAGNTSPDTGENGSLS
jgi:hypothetical protein